jgi:hypothetical protein
LCGFIFKEEFPFGLEIGGKSSRFFAEAGIRLPLVSPDRGSAMKIGEESDLDREEAFLDFTAVKVKINYRLKREMGLVFRLRLGATVLRNFETHSNGYEFPLTTLIGYKTGKISAGGYIGISVGVRNIKTARIRTAYTRGSDFSFKAEQHQGLWANISLSKLQPGVIISPSLNDNIIDSFALNLGIQLQ